jgi:hypothetical protein
MDFADTTIPSGTAPHGAEAVYALKIIFQHCGIVIEIITVSAAFPFDFFFAPKSI